MPTSNFTDSFWLPYKIPRVPEEELDPEKEIYVLSLNDQADPEKNPSAFLEWRKFAAEEFNVCEDGEPKIKKIFVLETLEL
jgi:hypothetical protein